MHLSGNSNIVTVFLNQFTTSTRIIFFPSLLCSGVAARVGQKLLAARVCQGDRSRQSAGIGLDLLGMFLLGLFPQLPASEVKDGVF